MYMDMYIYEYVNIRIYFYICNYWCLWICMYMDMYMYMIPFAEHWSVRYTARSHSWSLKFAFRHDFARSTHRILREGSSSRMKMCVSLQRRGMQKYGNVSFATVACAKCMRYGGRGGGPIPWGGGVATRDTEPYIYTLYKIEQIQQLMCFMFNWQTSWLFLFHSWLEASSLAPKRCEASSLEPHLRQGTAFLNTPAGQSMNWNC